MNAARLGLAPQRSDVADSAAALFAQAYGYTSDGVWSAPGRVNLIGEHVDYQAGLCLPMGIEHRCAVAAALRADGRIRLCSAQSDEQVEIDARDLAPGAVTGWAAYAAGAIWARTDGSAANPGLDILVDGRVPLGAGLSSSAALTCAVIEAADALLGVGADLPQRIDAAIRAETVFVGAPTGGLDQTASMRAHDGHALLLDCADGTTRDVPWDLAAEDLALLIVDTRAHHSHVGGGYGQRRAEAEEAARLLGVPTLRDVDPGALPAALDRIADPVVGRRARHIVTEIQRVRDVAALLDQGAIRPRAVQLGALLDASHESLRHDFEVTVTETDLAVDTARAGGAHGARMTGGGFGGSIIALVDASGAEDVFGQVSDAFARAGLTAPVGFLARAGAGAGRDR